MDTNPQARFARCGDWPANVVSRLFKRLLALATMLLLGLALMSCASFSNYVSDHWPTWAGGMPKDVPPRPGQPGYEEFVAHGQASQQPPPINTAAGAAPGAATAPPEPAAMPAAKVNVQETPAANPQTNNAAAAQGGLY